MNILLLSRYTRMGASSRLRTMQYLPALAREGLNVQVFPFFDDSYLQALYSGKQRRGSTTGYMVQRIKQLWKLSPPDLIWLEYEALPWIPWSIERAILPRRVPIVSDYDDAVFHRYDLHRSRLVRYSLGNKLDKLMASATLVTAGNRYLADRATAVGAPRVEIVPTVVDLTAYTQRPQRPSEEAPVIGWIGTPSTWTEYMAPIMPVLEQVAEAAGARIAAVGAGRAAAAHPLIENLPWTEDSEVARIHAMDIGIMPLTDTPWARGKCGYKLIQYMACGLPVVASPVGVNNEIVEHGVNGFLAESDDEWRAAIRTLLGDPDLRCRMGAAGRRKVEEQYSLQVWGPRVAQMLRSVIEDRANG